MVNGFCSIACLCDYGKMFLVVFFRVETVLIIDDQNIHDEKNYEIILLIIDCSVKFPLSFFKTTSFELILQKFEKADSKSKKSTFSGKVLMSAIGGLCYVREDVFTVGGALAQHPAAF